MITLENLQKQVDDWIQLYGVRYFSELTNMAILTEEVGELARIISRTHGDQSWKRAISDSEAKNKLADEMADILWVITCLANQTGVDLTEAVKLNIEKKTLRDSQRHKNNEKLS